MKDFFTKLKLTIEYFLKPKEIIFLCSLLFVTFFSFIYLIFSSTNYFKIDRILYKGQMSEAVIGTPKITNPFQSINQAERNLSALLFSSLIKNLQNDGKFDLALADKVEISTDKKQYKIYIKQNAKFSNDKTIESADVIYSLENIPYEKNFTTEILDNKTFTVNFKSSNTQINGFENLEIFTYPIIEKNSNFENTYSDNLITSSFFRVKNITQNTGGNITSISLERFNNGEEKLPYLKKYTLYFYNNEAEALADFQAKEINLLSGISGQIISKIKDDSSFKITNSKLSNNFSLFINQNKNEDLQDIEFRKILSESIDRIALTNQVFGGYALPEKNILEENSKNIPLETLLGKLPTGLKLENGVLYRADKPVKISITTINNKELVDTANFVANSWTKLGIETQVKTIERSSLQAVVKDRDFDILLFGFSIKNNADYYSFFHSKERNYPKLNIANYVRKKVDTLLEDLQNEKDSTNQNNLIKGLSTELENDMPIILLYKPFFVQAITAQVNVQMPESLYEETDKYKNIQNWYIYTEKVLKIFETFPVLKNSSNFLDKILN